MRQYLAAFCGVLLVVGLFVQPVHADHKTSQTSARLLKVGSFDLPPWGWIDDAGTPHGIIYELHSEVARRTGLPFINQMFPFRRLVEMLEHGELDMISGQPHESLLAAGEKLALLHTIDIIAVARRGSGVHSIHDFSGKTALYHRVASYPQIDGMFGAIQRVESYEQSIKMLLSRPNVDVALFSAPSFYYLVMKLGYSINNFGEIIVVERDREDWVFVRKGMSAYTKSLIREAVRETREDGVYDRLLKQYTSTNDSTQF